MQINRLLETVYLLIEKKKITARELSDYFEVSQRTIYRDVEALSAAGIPVYAEKGKGGGIRLLDNYVIKKSLHIDVKNVPGAGAAGGGSGAAAYEAHKHAYVGKKTFKVHNALKAGEKVLLIRVQQGKKFVVIDRVKGA